MQLIPTYGVVPDFHLIEASHKQLSRASLQGQVWVASFLFTSCAGTCPAMANRNRLLQSVMPEGVKLISISVDPERDTPEVLMKWGKRYGRDPQKWLLATGDFLRIRKLMIEGFHLQGDDPFNHSNGFALVDGRGFLRGYYDSLNEEDMTRLIRDSALVLKEAELLPVQKVESKAR
jgi:protein SCO1/2